MREYTLNITLCKVSPLKVCAKNCAISVHALYITSKSKLIFCVCRFVLHHYIYLKNIVCVQTLYYICTHTLREIIPNNGGLT